MNKLNISNVDSLFSNAITRHQVNDNHKIVEVAIDKIKLNRFQNRKSVINLDELAASIKENGIIQPLIVNANNPNDEQPYELVSGERRLKAAKKAGLNEVPVIIRNLNNKQIINFTLAENLQREDLTPVEIANGYKMWLNVNNGTYEQLAKAMHKSLGTIGSYMKIIKMDDKLKQSLQNKIINLKQALEINKLIDKKCLTKVINTVSNDNLTIKATAKLVKDINDDKKAHKNIKVIANKVNSEIARNYQHKLTDKYGKGIFKVTQKKENKTGKIEIKFKNDDELNELYHLINNWKK